MTKRPAPTGAGQERLPCGGSEIWESPCPDMSGTFRAQIQQCASYRPGHLIHWIHFNHSMREPSVVIPVTAAVDDDGLVHIEGDDLSLVRWNHRPALIRDALQRFGGMAVWKPRWYILAVPTEAFIGGARSVFSLAALDERRECYVPHHQPRPPHSQQAITDERAALRIAACYTAGRPRLRESPPRNSSRGQ